MVCVTAGSDLQSFGGDCFTRGWWDFQIPWVSDDAYGPHRVRKAAVAGLMWRCRTFRLMLSWCALQQDLTCKAVGVISLPEGGGISRFLGPHSVLTAAVAFWSTHECGAAARLASHFLMVCDIAAWAVLYDVTQHDSNRHLGSCFHGVRRRSRGREGCAA